MSYDIDVKRFEEIVIVSQKCGEFMLQIRVPGGVIDAKYLSFFSILRKLGETENFTWESDRQFQYQGSNMNI